MPGVSGYRHGYDYGYDCDYYRDHDCDCDHDFEDDCDHDHVRDNYYDYNYDGYLAPGLPKRPGSLNLAPTYLTAAVDREASGIRRSAR